MSIDIKRAESVPKLKLKKGEKLLFDSIQTYIPEFIDFNDFTDLFKLG